MQGSAGVALMCGSGSVLMICGFLWRCVYRGSFGVRMPVVTVDKQEKGEEEHMNQKEGLDYFPMECVTDENIKLITAEFGLQAFAIIVKIYQMIYSHHGYYCEWNEEVVLLFAQENGLGRKKVSSVNEILLCCMRRGVFSLSQYEQNGILTSKKIQEIFLAATHRRKKVEMKKAYLLVKVAHLSENVCILDENVDILNGNVITLEQSKVKESNNTYISTPTLGEIQDYVRKKGSRIDPVKFFNYYQMRNWCINGSFISDWEAAVDYWDSNEKSPAQSKDQAPGGKKAKNQFNAFDSRDVTNSEMQALEKMLLEK